MCDLQIRKVVGATGFEPATPCAQVAHYALSRNLLQSECCKSLTWRRFGAPRSTETRGNRADRVRQNMERHGASGSVCSRRVGVEFAARHARRYRARPV
jgi:hypothetical protein